MDAKEIFADARDMVAMAAEPLCPELAAHQIEGPFGPMIAHPLVHDIAPVAPGLLNRRLTWKQEQLKQFAFDGKWSSWVFAHERPYRVNAIKQLIDCHLIPDMQVGPLLAEIWTDTENIHQHLDDWAALFTQFCYSGQMMNDAEREFFDGLPDEFRIFRGECNDGGWSWTLDRAVAGFFANRETHAGTGMITTGRIEKRHVFAYLDRRDEEEILVEDRCFVKNQISEKA